MENDLPSQRRPNATEARESLDRLNSDGARLARRIVTPWWYYAGLGGIAFTMICSQALSGPGSILLIALAIVGVPLLTTTYSRRYGISTSQPAGRRGTHALTAAVVVLIAGMGSALAIRLTGGESWWVLVVAASTAAATVELARRYDAVLRAELARTADEAA